MNELDKKIREALRKEDAEVFEDFSGEPSVFEMLMETCRGRHRWLSILGAFWTLVFFVLGIFAAFQFFDAEQTRDLLMWAAACILCMSAVSMLKVWYFMEMNKNAITREIKRLELQIARLAARIKD
jgi:phosphatidylserine synthase